MKYFLIVLMFFIGPVYGQTTQNITDFVITIKTNNTGGASSDTSFLIPTDVNYTYKYNVDWNNDGKNISTNITGSITHKFDSVGTYTIRISGIFPRISFVRSNSINDATKLMSIEQWGNISWSNFSQAFSNCTHLVINAKDGPDLSKVSDLSYMFGNCSSISNVGNWNTSAVTNMRSMFANCTNFNQDIGNWNTSKVIDMSVMFRECSNFNQNIGNWNTSNVVNMSNMFYRCSNFNQNLNNWNTGSVADMSHMFIFCNNFNQNNGNWNTGSVTNMQGMFGGCSNFNQDISNWNTNKVINMAYLFSRCSNFNQNIGIWNTASVTNMVGMFNSDSIFNQNIGNWNTASVTNMNGMFLGCSNFNQNISNWNTTKVTDMSYLFYGCSKFNQSIGNWTTGSVTNMTNMLSECTNFNQDINNWNTSKVTDMSYLFFGCSKFNQNISLWNTAAVTDMTEMFVNCTNFNQNIGNWNTVSVTSMVGMFEFAANFNQDISRWNTSNVTSMRYMFYMCSNFNHSIGNWNIGKGPDMAGMLSFSGMGFKNYDSTLIGWQASTHLNNITLGADSLSYDAAAGNRDLLIKSSNWTIVNDFYLNNFTTPTLLINGTSISSNTITGIDSTTGFMQFINDIPPSTQNYLAINPKLNTGYNFSITAANNFPAINNQVKTDGATNTTALSNRMYTIVDTGTDNYPSGMTVRIYYSPNDSTAAVANLDTTVKSPLTSRWFKYSGTTHTVNVSNILANQSINNITGATFLVPSTYGTEKNISYVEFSNITSFSTFGFLASKTTFPLPIKLNSFTATTNNCTVNLVWKVAYEKNSSYYAIETSTNGKDFIQIAKVISNNSANGGSYEYSYVTDKGTHYFRLRAVDIDGKYTLSAIEVATINCSGEGKVSVSPNPTSDNLVVQGLANGSTVTLLDLTGKILINTQVNESTKTLNIGKYAKGIYLLHAKALNGTQNTFKVVKQ